MVCVTNRENFFFKMAYKKLNTTTSIPPLPRLKVRRPVLAKGNNKCVVLMSSLLSCWAANGEGAQQCRAFETELKQCMNEFIPQKEQRSSINYHASRLYPKLRGTVND